MVEEETPRWLKFAREIAAIGQTGIHFSHNEFDKLRYLQLVTIASEMIEAYAAIPTAVCAEVFLDQKGYATPKVDVRGAIFRSGQVLLVKERMDGFWSLPGGWADVNVPPSKMVEREVWEESGFRVRAKKLVGVYETNHNREPIQVFHAYKLVFLCEILSGEETISNETSEVKFFPIDRLPEFSPNRTRQEYITEAYAHLLDPLKAAVFD